MVCCAVIKIANGTKKINKKNWVLNHRLKYRRLLIGIMLSACVKHVTRHAAFCSDEHAQTHAKIIGPFQLQVKFDAFKMFPIVFASE